MQISLVEGENMITKMVGEGILFSASNIDLLDLNLFMQNVDL